jgi:hypothetical protein
MPPVPAHRLSWLGSPVMVDVHGPQQPRMRVASHTNEYVGALRTTVARLLGGVPPSRVRMLHAGEAPLRAVRAAVATPAAAPAMQNLAVQPLFVLTRTRIPGSLAHTHPHTHTRAYTHTHTCTCTNTHTHKHNHARTLPHAPPGKEFADDAATVGHLELRSARQVVNVTLSPVDNTFTRDPAEYREDFEAYTPEWLLSRQARARAAASAAWGSRRAMARGARSGGLSALAGPPRGSAVARRAARPWPARGGAFLAPFFGSV